MIVLKCFLLSTIKYGDADAVMHCYSEEEGYQSYFLKGVFAVKSKKKAYLFPLNCLNLTIAKGSSGKMPSVSKIELNADNADSFNHRLNSIRLFASDFLNQTLKNENGHPSLFQILENFNANLKIGQFNAHLPLVFEVLRWNGLLPLNSAFSFLDPESGEFSSQRCHQLFDEEISTIWKRFLEEKSFANIEMSKSERNRFLESMMLYYQFHFSGFKTPESLEVLKQVYA